MAKSKVARLRKGTKPLAKVPGPIHWTDAEVRALVQVAILGRELELFTAIGERLVWPAGRWWKLGNADVGVHLGGRGSGHIKEDILTAMPRIIALVNRLEHDPAASLDLRTLVAPLFHQVVMMAQRRLGYQAIPEFSKEADQHNLPAEALKKLAAAEEWEKFTALALQHGYPAIGTGYLRQEVRKEMAAEKECGSVNAWIRRQLDKLNDVDPEPIPGSRPEYRPTRKGSAA